MGSGGSRPPPAGSDETMPRTALVCLMLTLPAATARADAPPALPLRELMIEGDAAVAAEPAGGPRRFLVVEAFKGAALRPGDVVEVLDAVAYQRPRGEPDPARVDAALLFLRNVGGA